MKMAWFPAALAALLLAAPLAGCSSPEKKSSYIELDEDRGGRGIGPQDIRSMTDRMSRSLMEVIPALPSGQGVPTVFFDRIDNRSGQPLDTDMLLERIRVQLNKQNLGKLRFLARENLAAIEEERARKRAGEVTSGESKQVLGGDYILTGTITGLGGPTDDYWYISFRLVDAENSAIVWEDDYEFRRGEI
jgi:TolB-like protein